MSVFNNSCVLAQLVQKSFKTHSFMMHFLKKGSLLYLETQSLYTNHKHPIKSKCGNLSQNYLCVFFVVGGGGFCFCFWSALQ